MQRAKPRSSLVPKQLKKRPKFRPRLRLRRAKPMSLPVKKPSVKRPDYRLKLKLQHKILSLSKYKPLKKRQYNKQTL